MGLLDAIGDAAGAVADKVGDAADAVGDAVANVGKGAMLMVAEKEIKEITGMDITVDTEDIPSDWNDWIMKTGVNSLCTKGSWTFLGNERKEQIWKERGIDKIVMKVKTEIEDDERWIECMPEWEEGSKTLYLVWYPRAGNWESSNTWIEPGYKRWWNLADEISFGLQLYQLEGKCFYKSDWLENFEDDDPDSMFGGSKEYKRWFQFRHWIIYWYPGAMWGYNWQWVQTPPELPNGDLFNLDSVLSCPSLPDLTMPKITLPSLPDIEMPSLPDVSLPSAPSISAPSLSAPSLSAPDLSNLSAPSLPTAKKHPEGRWSAHGFIELKDMKVKADGKDIIFSNCTVHKFWKLENGSIDVEKLDGKRYVLGTTSNEQAESWKETLMASGVEEGDAGGCCVVA